MGFPGEDVIAFIKAHAGSVVVAAAVVLLPGVGFYFWLHTEYRNLVDERSKFTQERADAQIALAKDRLELERAKLEVERLQDRTVRVSEDTKETLSLASERLKEVRSEAAEVALARQSNDEMRQQLTAQNDFKHLADQFISLGVDLSRCYQDKARYEQAKAIASRLVYVARETRSSFNVGWADRIQAPLVWPAPCPSTDNRASLGAQQ